MKKFAIIFLLFTGVLLAQEFKVEKISGEVKVLRGSSEEWVNVALDETLIGTDLIVTDENGFIQLSKEGSRFILQRNSALGLNHIKNISINDLLLALAMEEIRNVPKNENRESSRNTAVYGTEEKSETSNLPTNDLGIKRLNGAKQLAESGYKESSIIAAKETYRKYPQTKSRINDRLYFTRLLIGLNLNQEAMDELADLQKQELTEDQKIQIDKLMDNLKLDSVSN